MQIDNMIIIPEDGIETLYKNVLQDGVAWTGLTGTVIIQRESDSKYWNNSNEAWEVGSVENDLTESKPGKYDFTNSGEIFTTPDSWDVTWELLDGATVVYAESETFSIVNGIAPDKQKVRDAMALATEESASGGSVDEKLDNISNSTSSIDSILIAINTIESTISQYTPMDKVILRNNLRLLMDKLDVRKTSSIISE